MARLAMRRKRRTRRRKLFFAADGGRGDDGGGGVEEAEDAIEDEGGGIDFALDCFSDFPLGNFVQYVIHIDNRKRKERQRTKPIAKVREGNANFPYNINVGHVNDRDARDDEGGYVSVDSVNSVGSEAKKALNSDDEELYEVR
ncbi:uncharacterized protein A4U43_C03F23560 [Asparagus officinalis]|uniref:Uncharacterized protein n=1 Tax=Asparagus officinalis TaxID=4686 RepID=A0A5P1FGQ7_ASPOF|nr:uncharacterized protein A4U43_C03F23560 [Asparagus officinalis]